MRTESENVRKAYETLVGEYKRECDRLHAENATLRETLREACLHIPDGSIPMDVAQRLTDAQRLP
jgi:hypothetical protein